MKITALLAALALASAPALLPSVAYAAHAGAPYKNVNKKNDKGNDTGDARTDQLNAAQLNQNYQGQNPGDMGTAPGTAGGMSMAPKGTGMGMAPGGTTGMGMAPKGTGMAPKMN